MPSLGGLADRDHALSLGGVMLVEHLAADGVKFSEHRNRDDDPRVSRAKIKHGHAALDARHRALIGESSISDATNSGLPSLEPLPNAVEGKSCLGIMSKTLTPALFMGLVA